MHTLKALLCMFATIGRKIMNYSSGPDCNNTVHPFHGCGILPNCRESMNLTTVVATDSVDDMPSKQFTTVPFSPVLTGPTTTLDIRGELS